MEEQTVHREKKRRRLAGWAKIVIAVALTLAASTGMWCLLLGRSGLAMVQTYLLARFAFVEADADLDKAVDLGLDAFVQGLGDRWSYYRTQEQYRELRARRANNYVGIGVTVNIKDREEGLLVESVTEGGPADKAGVVPGDVITAAGGVPLAGEARGKGSDYIKGEAGTQVVLTLLREDGGSAEVTCTRATLRSPSASGKLLEGDIGYVKLDNFYSGSADSFQKEVDALVEQGAQALIVDVRSDPGGYVAELEKILDYLLPEGPVFTQKARWWFPSVTQSDADCIDLPMVAMVNKDSYSAAELLAAQLRESVGAPIVGEPTSGKGYSQITFPLLNGGGVGLSTAIYCTGSGCSLIGEGIVPDVELSLSEGAVMGEKSDDQLQAAIDLLRK